MNYSWQKGQRQNVSSVAEYCSLECGKCADLKDVASMPILNSVGWPEMERWLPYNILLYLYFAIEGETEKNWRGETKVDTNFKNWTHKHHVEGKKDRQRQECTLIGPMTEIDMVTK